MIQASVKLIRIIINSPIYFIPQNRVNILMPSSSKLSRSTKPKTAQNNVCVVSNKLHWKKMNLKKNIIFSIQKLSIVVEILCCVGYILFERPLMQTRWTCSYTFKLFKNQCNKKQNYAEMKSLFTWQNGAKHSTHYGPWRPCLMNHLD